MILAEKGLDIPVEQVDLRSGAQFSEAYKAINPRCTVPALEMEDGSVLCDSRSIVRFLEEVYPNPPMLGETPREKALVEEWRTRIEQEGFMAVAEAFRNTAKGFKDSAITGPQRYAQIPELAARGADRVRVFWDVLDARLSDTAFLAGENFTAADVDAYIVVEFASRLQLGPSEVLEHLAAWREVVAARPSANA